MAFNDYHFVTTWRIRGTIEEVAQIITDGEHLARWWPSVYLDVRELEPGDERGIGKVIDLHTKGWLPYTLRWRLRVAEIHADGFTLAASGDFAGHGIWTFQQDGPEAVVAYDWQIRAEKPLLRSLTPILRPIFSANHHWAMQQGRRSLELELARRRATSAAERARIPPPPQPTTLAPGLLAVGMGLAAGLIIVLWRRSTSAGRARLRKG